MRSPISVTQYRTRLNPALRPDPSAISVHLLDFSGWVGKVKLAWY